MRNLKQTELQRLEERKAEDKTRTYENRKKNKKQCPATLKRLKRGDDNELERNLTLEKVVDSEQLRLAVEAEEERRARLEQLPNCSVWPWRLTKKENKDWRRW